MQSLSRIFFGVPGENFVVTEGGIPCDLEQKYQK